MENYENINPFELFTQWFEQAKAGEGEANAMSLATADKSGRPSVRMVLLKGLDKNGFVFYTNLQGRKAQDLAGNPQAALCFYWPSLSRQVRVEGRVEPVSDAEADAYFATRARGSQVGAWASRQSCPLESREKLLAETAEREKSFADTQTIPRPSFWSGFRLVPDYIEFWQEQRHRLHDRVVFRPQGDGWCGQLLYP